MSGWLVVYAALAKTAVLCTGAVILFYTVSAAYHTGDDGLWFLSVGIFLAGLGLLCTGLLTFLVGIDTVTEIALTSTVSAIGLALVIYSMFTDPRVRITCKLES